MERNMGALRELQVRRVYTAMHLFGTLPAGLALLLAFHAAGAQTGTPTAAEALRTTTTVESALDLNTATAAQLRALPGMGDAYVRRVLDGRPYTAKNQLVTRGILPQSAYERIRDRIVAHRPPRP